MTAAIYAVISCLVLVGCSAGNAVPPHDVVGQQGMVRFIVISPEFADQDEALWQIADDLRRDMPNQAIQALFWTNKADAGTGLPLADRAIETQVAQIDINPATSHRELTRPNTAGLGR